MTKNSSPKTYGTSQPTDHAVRLGKQDDDIKRQRKGIEKFTKSEKSQRNTFLRILIMIFNVLVGPVFKCFVFVCVGIQTFVAIWSLYHYTPSFKDWFYNNILTVFIYIKTIIECFASFALLTSLIEKSNGFLGGPVKKNSSLYSNAGFTLSWNKLGFFFIISCNIADARTIKVLMDNFCSDINICHIDIVYEIPSYTSFSLGIICLLVGLITTFLRKRCQEVEPKSTSYKTWREITPTSTKYLLIIYYIVIISSTVFFTAFRIAFIYDSFKKKDDTIFKRSDTKMTVNRTITILLWNVPHLVIAVYVFTRLAKRFWTEPFKQISYLTILLYLYSLASFFSQLPEIKDVAIQFGWNINVKAMIISVVVLYIIFPILFWGLFISADFGRHDEKALSYTPSYCVLLFRFLRRICYPFKEFVCERKHWSIFFNTIAILLATTGGLATVMSTRYEKIHITFKAKETLQNIGKDFKAINDNITNVANGFIIVAANLNPCLDYAKKSPSSSGKSINDLLRDHATAKGKDGHRATILDGDQTLMQTLYDNGNKDFKRYCFKNNGGLTWSQNRSALCKNVKYVQENNNFTMTKLHDKEKNSGTYPDCSTPEKCLESSNRIIPPEYTLSVNKQCETTTCGLFITGIIGAFATSFIPFAGPPLAKGIQYTLRTYKLVKKFGKIFKRVATQVKEKREKIRELHKTFSKILGAKTLTFKNNYQFYYFLAPTILMFLIAVGLGFYRRKRPTKLSKRLFVLLFMLMSVQCTIMTWLSFKFSPILYVLLEPFGIVLDVEVKELLGIQMIKGGYLMVTLSCVFFIASACISFNDETEIEQMEMSMSQEKSLTVITETISSEIKDVEEHIEQSTSLEAYDIKLDVTDSCVDQKEKIDKEYITKKVEMTTPMECKTNQQERSSFEDRFSSWLMAFVVTIPVYYIIITSILSKEQLIRLKITPSSDLEKVRVSFAHTSALEREFGNVDDLNSASNDNICDITQAIAMAIIKAIDFKIPGVSGGLSELFKLNVGIREVVAGVNERVRNATDLKINGFHIFNGHNFAVLKLPYSEGFYILVYSLPIFITVCTTICLLLSFLQVIGIFKRSKYINLFMEFSGETITSLSITALSTQLAIIGIFSFLDGFESAMFNFSLEIGKLLTHGTLVSVLLIISSIFRVLTNHVPIAIDEVDIIM